MVHLAGYSSHLVCFSVRVSVVYPTFPRLYPSSVTRVLRSSFTPSTRAGGGPSRNVERRGTRRYEEDTSETTNGGHE